MQMRSSLPDLAIRMLELEWQMITKAQNLVRSLDSDQYMVRVMDNMNKCILECIYANFVALVTCRSLGGTSWKMAMHKLAASNGCTGLKCTEIHIIQY